MSAADYVDFDLEITRLAKGRYRARVIDSPAGEATADFKRPFSDLELENFVLKIGRTRSGMRSLNSPEMQAAEAFGKKLFEAIFQEGVRECLTSSLHQVDRDEIPGLRLRLRLVGVPELANIPWEYLYHTTLRRFIVLSTQTPIVRYTDLPRPVQPLAMEAPLRLLMMVSSPADYKPLDVLQEKAKIETALRYLEQRGLVTVEWLEKATLSALQQRLRKEPVHLFHFIGHGGYDRQAQDGLLVFEDEHGRGRLVGAVHLATILRDHKSLRLVVLNACEGGRASPTDPFAGVAGTLVQQGVPAVLAMQFEITDAAAIELARVFYESLADGYSAEAALAEARKAIFASGNDVEWGTPVLYLRAPEGRLFDLPAQAERVASHVSVETRSETLSMEKAIEGEPSKELAWAAPTVTPEPAIVQPVEQTTVAPQQTEVPKLARQRFAAISPENVHQVKLIRVLAGHAGSVESVAFSPDGALLASSSFDRTIWLWRTSDGTVAHILNGHTGEVFGVAISPDGKLLASGSWDRTVRLWRVSDGALVHTLRGHTDQVDGVAFSQDGHLLASGSKDFTVKLWRVADGTLVHTLAGHTLQVYGVAFSPNGQMLASTSWDSTVRLWWVSDGTEVRTLTGHTNNVYGIAFSPDGTLLASGAKDNTVKIWQVSDGSINATLEGHTAQINSVAFSPDGSMLASASNDLTVRLWRLQDGAQIHSLQGHIKQVNGVAFSPDGSLLASASGGYWFAEDPTVRLWGIPSELN